MVTNERLHQPIDVLPPDAVATAARVLAALSGLAPDDPPYLGADAPLGAEPAAANARRRG